MSEADAEHQLFTPGEVFAATPVTKFYTGKTLFVTGGTGFLGMILLGKLLATCPVKRVYLLVKPKKGKDIQERISDLIKSPVFTEVEMNNKSALQNIIPIAGDIRELKLGMSEEDITILNREVQVVFHVAANINMSSDLADVVKVNAMGTGELAKLSKGMRQLMVFVYVSTAYSNCNRKLIDERVYTPKTSLEAVYGIYDQLMKENNKIDVHHLLDGRPNAYTYAKSLAETIIQDEIVGIPTVIVRPSIVVSPKTSPMPGWTTTWNSVNVITSAIAEGALCLWKGRHDCVFDIVPVDQVANLLIASAWDADRQHLQKVKVFNCCTGLQNPIKLKDFLGTCLRISMKHSNRVFYTGIYIFKNRTLYVILWFFMQAIPAFFVDIYARLTCQIPRMQKMNSFLSRTADVVEYFTINDYTFIDYNVRRLLRDMAPRDRLLFDFDFSAIDWPSYLDDYVRGMKKYLTRK